MAAQNAKEMHIQYLTINICKSDKDFVLVYLNFKPVSFSNQMMNHLRL